MHGEATQGEEDLERAEEQSLEDSLLRAVAEPPLPLRLPTPGTRLGGPGADRFEIFEKLGGGSMGYVFRAWDGALQRTVALKFLRPRGTLPGGLVSSLLRQEARAIAQLDHEHIVRIFDVAEWDSPSWEPRVPFLVMEYLEGETLSSLLRRGRLGIRHALELMEGLTAGLAHAHARHVIHRDLKPRNIFLGRDGRVKLLDFGLAHFTPTPTASVLPHLPMAGTPWYMAPEQWRGAPQDARTDVWAAGVLLYEMLVGEPPYRATSVEEFREKVTAPEPVPSVLERLPELPEGVETLLAKALAKDPSARFPSAVELHQRVSQLLLQLGSEPPRSEAAPQRRPLTLLACQLGGAGNGLEPLEAEDAGELQAAFHRLVSEAITAHGGSVASCLGNQGLACFGYPRAHEDDSERAARAGLHLTQALPEALQQALPHLPRSRLVVRVGVHTGPVVVDQSLSDSQPTGVLAIQGEAPAVATWLARLAEPGTVLISGTTWTLVRGAFVARALGPRALDGAAGGRRVELFRLLRSRRVPLRFARVLHAGGLTPLVDREQELRTLLGLWQEAARGQSACVLVAGEAGLGKSRLIQELCGQAPLQAAAVARGQCWPQLRNSAFHPVIDLLRSLLHLDASAPEPELREKLIGIGLEPSHVRQLQQLLCPTAFKNFVPQALEPAQQRSWREQLCEALLALAQRVSGGRPILAVLEDVHWADPSTLALIGLLLQRLAGLRLLLVLSARPEFQSPWPPKPSLHSLVLGRLSAERTAALVREVARGRPLSAEAVEALVARTDGVPLFVEEMARMVLTRTSPDDPMPEPPSIPITLNELLLARLDTLPARQRTLAQWCAVVGRDVSAALLAHLWREEEELSGLLESGLLLRREGADGPGYVFRHVLLQEAAYLSLPRGARRRYHARIAQVLEAQFPEVGVERPEVLAHHHTQAGASEPALRWWLRASELAQQRSADMEAVGHLSQALKLLGALPEGVERTRLELPLQLMRGLSLMRTQGFRAHETERAYARAEALLLQGEEGSFRLGLLTWGVSSYYFGRAEFGRMHRLAEEIVSRGQRAKDAAALVEGYRMMAIALLMRGELEAAARRGEQAVESARFRPGEHHALLREYGIDPEVGALVIASGTHAPLGQLPEARRRAHEGLSLARHLENPRTCAFALVYSAMSFMHLRETKRAMEWVEEGLALCREHHFEAWVVVGLFVQGCALIEQGQLEEGGGALRKAIAGWKYASWWAHLPAALARLAELHLRQGEPEEGLRAVREAREWARETGVRMEDAEHARLQGELLRLLGEEEEAMRHFVRALVIARRQHYRLVELRAATGLARHLRDTGQAERARRLLARFRGGSDELVDLREARALLAELALTHEPGAPAELPAS